MTWGDQYQSYHDGLACANNDTRQVLFFSINNIGYIRCRSLDCLPAEWVKPIRELKSFTENPALPGASQPDREVLEMNGRHVEEVTYSLVGLLGLATVSMFMELCYILLQR